MRDGTRIDAHEALREEIQAEERDLAIREQKLEDRSHQLRKLARTVELAEIEKAVEERKRELDEVLKQLGEKRSLLSRMLGRGGPPS